MKKCETFGCSNEATQMPQIAPGTNVWLCVKCIERAKAETAEQGPPIRRAA